MQARPWPPDFPGIPANRSSQRLDLFALTLQRPIGRKRALFIVVLFSVYSLPSEHRAAEVPDPSFAAAGPDLRCSLVI